MNRFKNILFVADSSSKTCPALERAVTLAATNDARLTVVDVIDEVDDADNIQERFGVSLTKLLLDHRLESLSKLVAPFQSSEHLIYTKVLMGKAFAEIVQTVIQNGYDLVIKAMRPPATLNEHLLGSTDLHLLRKCPCPVWIDRPGKDIPYKTILAAVDPMDDKDVAIRIMQLATSLAEREQANVEILHSWRLQGESTLRGGYARLSNAEVDLLVSNQEKTQVKKLNALLADFNLSTDDENVHFVKGHATQNILDFGEGADLIVMRTIGRAGIPGFLIGNTAEDVMLRVSASILAVKPDGFISPLA